MIAMLRRRLMSNRKKMCTVEISGFSSINWFFGRVSTVENSTQETSLTDGTYDFEQGTQLYCSMTSKQENYSASIKLDGKFVAIKSYPYAAKYTLVLNSDYTVAINYALALMEITTLGEKLILSYDAQGGSGSFAAQEGVADSTGYATFVVPDYSPFKSGYTFIGWALTPTAATAEYGSGDSIKINKDTTLYAVYQEQSQPQPDVYYIVTVSDGSEQGSTANCAPSIGGTGTYNVKGGSSITLYCYKSPNPDSDTAYIIVNGTNVITNTTYGKKSYTYYVDKNCTISVYNHGLSTSTSVS